MKGKIFESNFGNCKILRETKKCNFIHHIYHSGDTEIPTGIAIMIDHALANWTVKIILINLFHILVKI